MQKRIKMALSFSVSAPGKIILHGEHSVVYGKTAIAASLGFRTYTKIEEIQSSKPSLIINLQNFEVHKIVFDVEDLFRNVTVPDFNWTQPLTLPFKVYYESLKNYLQSFVSNNNLVLKDFEQQALVIILYVFIGILKNVSKEQQTPSISLDIRSDLTIGAGTGSSASYAVSISGALLHYLRLKYPDEYYSKISENETDKSSKAFSNDEKRTISEWAFCCEQIAHGMPSGIDNSVCTYGSIIEFRKAEVPTPHDLKVQLKFILVNSNVSRQTKVLVKNVSVLREKYPKTINNIMEALDDTALNALKIMESLTDDKKCEAEYEELSVLVDLNHNLLAALQASHPVLEKIRTRAGEHNLKCKLTGAGGGGYAIIFVPPSCDDSNVEKLIKVLKEDGFDAKLVDLGVEGVRVE